MNHSEPVSFEAVIAETYKYGGVAGRVSQRDLAITLNGNTGETFTQSWTYTDLGDVASVTYPRCTFSRCTLDGAGTTRTVSPTYTRGFLTAVPGYAGAITYHPSGLVDAITHANSVVVTHGVDPDAMARPASITATWGPSTLWSTGTLRLRRRGQRHDDRRQPLPLRRGEPPVDGYVKSHLSGVFKWCLRPASETTPHL